MEPLDQLDRRIDDHLRDTQTEPSTDFTANVLDQLSQDRANEETFSDRRRSWWFALPIAATITLVMFPPSNDSGNPSGTTAETTLPQANETVSVKPSQLPLSQIEEILVMEDSLRDFEILFDADALEILALLEE